MCLWFAWVGIPHLAKPTQDLMGQLVICVGFAMRGPHKDQAANQCLFGSSTWGGSPGSTVCGAGGSPGSPHSSIYMDSDGASGRLVCQPQLLQFLELRTFLGNLANCGIIFFTRRVGKFPSIHLWKFVIVILHVDVKVIGPIILIFCRYISAQICKGGSYRCTSGPRNILSAIYFHISMKRTM